MLAAYGTGNPHCAKLPSPTTVPPSRRGRELHRQPFPGSRSPAPRAPRRRRWRWSSPRRPTCCSSTSAWGPSAACELLQQVKAAPGAPAIVRAGALRHARSAAQRARSARAPTSSSGEVSFICEPFQVPPASFFQPLHEHRHLLFRLAVALAARGRDAAAGTPRAPPAAGPDRLSAARAPSRPRNRADRAPRPRADARALSPSRPPLRTRARANSAAGRRRAACRAASLGGNH